jgi:hypothetical protein
VLFAFELSCRLGALLAEEFAPEELLAPVDEFPDVPPEVPPAVPPVPPAEPPAPPADWAFTYANDRTAPATPTMTNRARWFRRSDD